MTAHIIDRRFPNQVFARRRQRVLEWLRSVGGGVAIIGAAPTPVRSRDSDFPYRQNSDFFYLTGFNEPEALLVLNSRAQGTAESPAAILFCREKDVDREIWEGFHYGPAAACSTFGLDSALPNSERDAQLTSILTDAGTVAYPFHPDNGLDSDMRRWLANIRGRRGVLPPHTIRDLSPEVEAMRIVKDASELARMREAARISARAHIRAMRASRPGVPEYAIEAELLYAFRREGAQAPAYTSIVAAGANACVLHYPAGDKILEDGDLVLIDAACELDGYAADITRTFPANGHFTGPQRTLYDIVLAANQAAADATRAGARFDDGHYAALGVLVQGMLDTGLLARDKHGGVEDVIADKSYSRFYMHSTGHWLGLDVHDCGDYLDPTARAQQTAERHAAAVKGAAAAHGLQANMEAGGNAEAKTAAAPRVSRLLEPGMVLTIEPGLYIRPGPDVPEAFWNIGIRVEDNAVVTETGCELITRDVPVAAEDIEALMSAAR